VQAGADSDLAASKYIGPTVYSMFGWSHNNKLEMNRNPQSLAKLRLLYHDVECFVLDEANALAAHELAMIDIVMEELICHRDSHDKISYEPFGGKTVVFLSDAAQLKPIYGSPIYGEQITVTKTGGTLSRVYRSAAFVSKTRLGQQSYKKYLVPNCIYLTKGQINKGLLLSIMDRLRNGDQTMDNLQMLTYQKRMFPAACFDHGVHYTNEQCTLYNFSELWDDVRKEPTASRSYVHLCGAHYYVTGNNDHVVSALSSIPANDYGYAQDVLCLTEGVEVRLVKNVNVTAGLVNSSVGTVIK
jgi:hypothetical protein